MSSSGKIKKLLTVAVCILLLILTSFLSIEVYKAYAIQVKYRTCIVWEYNFDYDYIKNNSAIVVDEPYGFKDTTKYIAEDGSYLMVYPDGRETFFCQNLNCFYGYENGELVSVHFGMNDFPGENYVLYDLK